MGSWNGNLIYQSTLGYNAQEHVSSLSEKVSGGGSYTTTYSYDRDARATEIRYGSTDHRIRYTYDGQGRLASRRVNNGTLDMTSTFSYLPSTAEFGVSAATSTYLVNSIAQNGVSFAYEYADDTNNIVKEIKTGGNYPGETTYEYDSIGQLTRANLPHDTRAGSTGTTWVYTYDLGGNMLNKKMYAYTTGTPQTLKQTITYGYTNNNWKDQLKAYNGVAIEYDDIGNVIKDENGYQYTWRKGRELATITKPDGTVVTFRYDQNGQRVRKVVTKDGVETITNYFVSGNRIVHMTHPNAAFHFYYDAQGKPNIFKYNGGWYSYLYNLQGDVIAILDSAGNIVVEYNYDVWGATLTKTGSMAGTLGVYNPFRYRGYVFDLDTGLYYLRSRYYNPKWGRFINADVVLGENGALLSHNSFAYCYNNPTTFIDPDGDIPIPLPFLDPITIIALACAAVVLIGICAIMHSSTDTWNAGAPNFGTFPQAQSATLAARVRSENELQTALLEASISYVGTKNFESKLQPYYVAFVVNDKVGQYSYLMCINEPLSLEEARIALSSNTILAALSNKVNGFIRGKHGIYTVNKWDAYDLSVATNGTITADNHYETGISAGDYYWHYHAFGKSGPHIWFGQPAIRY